MQTRMIVIGLVSLLGVLPGITAYRRERSAENIRILEQVGEQVDRHAYALSRELAEAREGVLAVKSLFDSLGNVDRSAFGAFAAEIVQRHAGLVAIVWIPRVSTAEPEHLRPGARVGNPKESRPPRTPHYAEGATGKTELFPVLYAEPDVGSGSALALDLRSNVSVGTALRKAAAAGDTVLSDPIRSPWEPNASAVLLVAPAFESLSNPGKPRSLRGYTAGILNLQRLIRGSMAERGNSSRLPINFQLVDRTRGRSEVVYSSAPGLADATDPHSEQRNIVFCDREWALVGFPTSNFMSDHSTPQPLLLGVSVFLAYQFLLAAVLSLFAFTRQQARNRETGIIRSALAGLMEGVIVADSEGRILVVNDAARRLLGEKPPHVPSLDWSRTFGLFVPGTDRLFPVESLPLTRTIHGEEVENVELFVRNEHVPSGAWVTVSGSPLRDHAGQVIGGVVAFRDITAQKTSAELSLRLTNAIEATADSIFITDCEGRIQYVNPAFQETTGYSPAEAIGQTPRLLKSGQQNPEYYAALWSTIKEGRPFKGTVVNSRKNGNLFWAEQTITPVKDIRTGVITHYVSVLRDMTERMKLQEQEMEMRMAATVQRRLLPTTPSDIPGLEIAGQVYQALATGGDFFDFVRLPDGRLAFAVADVSGHGLGSALIMAETRAYFRSLVSTVDRIVDIVERLNTFLFDDLERRQFVTMVLGVIDPVSWKLTWANMGHPSAYMLDRNGAVKETMNSTSRPLGLFADCNQCEARSTSMEPGEMLIVFTDGLTEIASAEGLEFEASNLLEAARNYKERSARELVEGILHAGRTFAGGPLQRDDITVVVFKRTH